MNKLARNIVSSSSSLTRRPKPLSRPAPIFARHNSSDTPESPAVTPDGQQDAAKFLQELNEESGFPDLMTPDILMDLHESVTFAPSRRTPYQNKVVVRNDPSMFDALKELHEGPRLPSGNSSRNSQKDANADDETDPLKFLHLTSSEVQRLYRYPIIQRRVTQQTGKGKMMRQHVVMVVGNQNGLMGIGEGKSAEPQRAMTQALTAAVRNMDYIERFEDRTVWTETETKFSSTRVILRPRPIGFGLHCNPNIYHLLKAAGIKDASAKVWGSRNPLQVIKATVRMLSPGNAPLGMGNGLGGRGRRVEKGSGMRAQDDIERERGRKLVHLQT